MRFKELLFGAAITLVATSVNAQSWMEDSVAMGANYQNDAFYSLQNGTVATAPNNNWHLAFQTTPQGPYGNVSIFANHALGVSVYSLHLKASTNFATLSAGDTVGKTGASRELFNSTSTWNIGAFNRMNDSSNMFDYSWGVYDQLSHTVIGDSLYLVTLNNGVDAYKVWVKEYVSTPASNVHWEFRIAKFDGSEDTTIQIFRSPSYTDRLFAYYNMVTNVVTDREPSRSAWDLLFTRYKEYVPGAPGNPYYTVTGVLSNFDVEVAKKMNTVENDTVAYPTFPYSPLLNAVGSDWKSFNMTTYVYDIADSVYYFIKTKNTNEYYQWQFLGFSGSTDGKIMFRKRLLGAFIPTGVSEAQPMVSFFKFVPNPAGSTASLVIDYNQSATPVQIVVTDIFGKVVSQKTSRLNQGLNSLALDVSSYPSGTYIVTMSNGNWKKSDKLIVQH